MNAGIKLATVYVAGALLVAGCGQSNSGSAGTSPGQPAAAAKPVASKDGTIKVKGLYIGMDIQTAPAVLKEMLADKAVQAVLEVEMNKPGNDAPHWIISEVAKGGDNYLPFAALAGNTAIAATGNLFVFVGSILTPGTVSAGPDGKVSAIVLPAYLVNELFNAADMDASAFVQQFANSYHIPEMKVSDNLQSWTYTSPDGTKITIDTTKAVVLEKVASAQDRKQSFN